MRNLILDSSASPQNDGVARHSERATRVKNPVLTTLVQKNLVEKNLAEKNIVEKAHIIP